MAEYYVVRDKNTGLYFRGKGVNRWGKHYNQASIYRIKGQAECTIKEVAWHGEQAEIVPIQIFESDTDVVRVVRCKDCVYYKEPCKEFNYHHCSHSQWDDSDGWAREIDPVAFCSYGEQRGDEPLD